MAETPTGGEQILFAEVEPATIDHIPADAAPSGDEHARVTAVLRRGTDASHQQANSAQVIYAYAGSTTVEPSAPIRSASMQ